MRHEPKIITRAFPVYPGTSETYVTEEGFFLPESAGEKCPLLVRVVSNEDVSDEIRHHLANGIAVCVCCADQSEMERDRDACTAWQEKLDQHLNALLAENPILDKDHIFVDGWISAFLIFHTDRFAAAIQRPALINPSTAYGNCAAGWVPPFGESMEAMILSLGKQSVLLDVDACKTPCLVLYREGDKNYSREQSEQLYGAMKDRNPDVPCRMVVFTPAQWDAYGLEEISNWLGRFLEQEVQTDGE